MRIFNWRNSLLDAEISPSSKLIGFILAEYFRENKPCYPSLTTLCEVSGFGSRNTVLKAIDELHSNGLIMIEKHLKKGQSRPSNKYVFVGVMSNSEPLNEPRSEPLNEPLSELSPELSVDGSLGELEIDEEVEYKKRLDKSNLKKGKYHGRKNHKSSSNGTKITEFLNLNENSNGDCPREWENHASSKHGWHFSETQDAFDAFCDHWRSATGEKARSCDWFANWRKWCAVRKIYSNGQQSKGGASSELSIAVQAARELISENNDKPNTLEN